MEKEQKQELGWRVSVLPIPAFHHCEPLCVACTQCTVECRNGYSIPILVSVLFPSLHLKYFRIKFLLLVYIETCQYPQTQQKIKCTNINMQYNVHHFSSESLVQSSVTYNRDKKQCTRTTILCMRLVEASSLHAAR